jgi:peptidyl-dipeptidase Dcp
MTNPLLGKFRTAFETVPFEEIKVEHFGPALDEAITQGLIDIKGIVDQSAPANFTNTILALEEAGELVSRVSGIFFNLNSAETNEQIQALARDLSPKLSKYQNDIVLNEALFARVKTVWENRKEEKLEADQFRLLEKTYRSFARNGALLGNKEKLRLRELDARLAELSLAFGENLLAETNNYELYLTEDQLGGLPDYLVESAREEAEEKGKKDQYLITLQAPSYLPFMTYAKDRSLREKLFRAFGSRASQNNDHDNQKVIKEIAQLRLERAQLLAYQTHADYVLEERMAGNPAKVQEFINELLEPSLPAAKKEVAELVAFAKETDGLESLQRWDFSYYSEKLKQARYEVDDQLLKPYFELNQVIQGAFTVAEKLYGIRFIERNDIQKYHPEVITYEVQDADEKHLAVFYADFFPRAGKRNGAWMTSYRGQRFKNGREERPHVSIVCNFTKPSKNSPSLLTFNEVLTLFHEFGHSLHGILAEGRYGSLTGTNVLWDFVELPSQIMENWCYQKECLDLFARHYETGESIPEDLVERLKRSANFMEAYATVRQLSFASLDLAWHQGEVEQIKDVKAFEADIFKSFDLLPAVPGTNMSCTFGHIFQGGYAAGYYSYKWAEVLDADAFESFQERGIFDKEVAAAFRKLLAAGDSVHPSELYRQFKGQDPDPKALLRRAGLVEKN